MGRGGFILMEWVKFIVILESSAGGPTKSASAFSVGPSMPGRYTMVRTAPLVSVL